MKQSLRLGTIAGIPVGLNWGMLVLALLYVTSLATRILPSAAPGSTTTAYWLTGALGITLFFISILAHELGHSLVAQREGIRVRAITLWLLGGVAELETEAKTPGAEFRIAAAGPAVSLAFALTFAGSGLAVSGLFGASVISTMLGWLGLINGLLVVFNLIPAAPLDGGRILTAILWHRSRNPYRARAQSARVGQGFGILMVALGALAGFSGQGFFILLLAWFLYAGATAERRRAELFEVATQSTVGQVMSPLAAPTDSAVTVSGLLAMSGGTTRGAFPVRGADGAIVGIVPRSALGSVRPKQRDLTRAGDIAVPWEKFVSARAGEQLSIVVDRFRDANEFHALVYDDWGNQTGYIGMQEISAARSMANA